MRIAHISDSHFDERGRLKDDILLHEAFLNQALEEGVDLILHTGDLFERRSTPAERLAVKAFFEAAAEVAQVVLVKGNHEAQLDVDLWHQLRDTGRRVHVITGAVGATPGSAHILNVKATPPIGILGLPWFDKAHLVAQLGAQVSQEKTRQLTIATAGKLLAGYVAEANRLRDEGIVPIMGAHVLVQGSEVSSGQTLIGTTVELAPGDLLDIPAAYIGLGHVHKTQTWEGGRMAYAGSPKRCNFGEPEAKGWRLIEILHATEGRVLGGGTMVSETITNEFRALPARPMIRELISAEAASSISGERLREQRADLIGAIVRVRYEGSEEILALIDKEVVEKAYLHAGAEEVKVEPILEDKKAVRVQEVREAGSVADKAVVFWNAKGLELHEPCEEELRSKIERLEEEARHEAQ
jgi:exonuclease SbcD